MMPTTKELQVEEMAGDVDYERDQAEFDAAAEKAFAEDADTSCHEALQPLSTELLREFEEAKQLRQETEQRWLKDLRQFRGRYEPDVELTLKNRSKSFVRRTRVKVVTTDSRMMDYLFPAGQEKNWTCEPTPKPSVDKAVRQQIANQLAQAGGGQAPSDKMVDEAVFAMCQEAAKGMSKVMDDQLTEIRYKQVTRKALHSGNLYGTGILKGPLVEKKVRQRFKQEGGQWGAEAEEYVVPFVEFVPIWRFYPDMAGAVELENCRFTYEEHTFARNRLADLIGRKSFNGQAIKEYLEANPKGQSRTKEYQLELQSLGERDGVQTRDNGMYDVLERWGWLTGEQLAQCGVEVKPERLHESFFSNVWLLPNGQIIKAVLQPIDGVTWPYHLYHFDKDETSIFGEGLASIMRDDQDMLNAAIRMMLDNGALTSGPMLEMCLEELANPQRADEIFPWKIWYRKKAGDKPAIRQIQLENNLEWLTKMAALFEQNSDEVTAIPRYMSGENATTGAAGTASGMSMLMGQANIVIKELLNSWDEGITRGFIQSLYRWNMKFSSDNAIKGDFDVKARGTASLIAKEVQAQRLNEFAQGTATQPQFAPFIKTDKLLRKIAEVSEMSDVVKTEDEIKQEQASDLAKKQQELDMRLREATVAELEGKAAKLMADAQVAKTKVDEMLANIEKMAKETERIVAETVDRRVQSIFAALQAGGVATRDALSAPAGDEILRSAGFEDKTPEPTIAQLAGPPVQPQQIDQRVMGKGEAFAADPRLPGASDPQVSAPGATEVQPPAVAATAQPEDPSGHIGQRAGIETTRIEGM